MRWGCGIAILVLCVLSVAHAQDAALTIHRNLAELIDESSDIIHGRIVSATIEPHPTLTNLTTVLVTVQVEDTLKGTAAGSFTFRQYVWDIRARYNKAGYGKGRELLLFLRPPSRYGLSSPAGLEQGRFIIERDARGHAMAVNGRGNAGLFDRLAENARARRVVLPAAGQKLTMQQSGPVDLGALKQVVRAMAGAAR